MIPDYRTAEIPAEFPHLGQGTHMANFADFKRPSELVSFYVDVANQLDELSELLRQRPEMAARFKGLAGEVREDIASGTVLMSTRHLDAIEEFIRPHLP